MFQINIINVILFSLKKDWDNKSQRVTSKKLDNVDLNIYSCPILMEKYDMNSEVIPKFELIITNNTKKIKEVHKIFMNNMKIREIYNTET